MLTYSVPRKRIGVAWNALRLGYSPPSETSPVRYVQATSSADTFAGEICVSGEKRVPPGVPP